MDITTHDSTPSVYPYSLYSFYERMAITEANEKLLVMAIDQHKELLNKIQTLYEEIEFLQQENECLSPPNMGGH